MGKKHSLAPAEALARFDRMLPRVMDDVAYVLRIEETMEGANQVVLGLKEHREAVQLASAESFEVIQNSLALNLALALARLYDPGSRRRFPRDQRDVASIPALLWLLRKAGCAQLVVERAERWMWPSGLEAGRSLVRETRCDHARFTRSQDGRRAIGALREFRNKYLAHTLMIEIEGSRPRYADLFRLSDHASRVAPRLLLVGSGRNWDVEERRRINRGLATEFWQTSLNALVELEKSRAVT